VGALSELTNGVHGNGILAQLSRLVGHGEHAILGFVTIDLLNFGGLRALKARLCLSFNPKLQWVCVYCVGVLGPGFQLAIANYLGVL